MQSALILENIGKQIDLQAEEADFFVSLLKEKQIKPQEYLLQEGEICIHSIFVNAGCLRSYTLDKKGSEHILQFAPSGWWIADMYSMLTRQPGELYIEAMEDTEVLLLHVDDREKLLLKVPKFERFFLINVADFMITFRQRLMGDLGLPARDRYLLFCSRYPTLIEKLPQKQIALYIGVTPEFLSEMRAEMLRNL
jgi:CRP-like cAMP-binding protein